MSSFDEGVEAPPVGTCSMYLLQHNTCSRKCLLPREKLGQCQSTKRLGTRARNSFENGRRLNHARRRVFARIQGKRLKLFIYSVLFRYWTRVLPKLPCYKKYVIVSNIGYCLIGDGGGGGGAKAHALANIEKMGSQAFMLSIV